MVASYSSDRELDGVTYRRCQNRRAAVCPSCSREYKGDAWHLLVCGLAGGKTGARGRGGASGDVRHPDRAVVRAGARRPAERTVPGTPGPPGLPARPPDDVPAPARARRTGGWGSRCAGTATTTRATCCGSSGRPELWRRFTIALHRRLAASCGLTVTAFRKQARVSYAKVVEFQARGLIHVHVPIRLDGPDGPDTAPDRAPGRGRPRRRLSCTPPQLCGWSSTGSRTGLRWRCAGAARSTSDPSPPARNRDAVGRPRAPASGRGVPGEVPDQGVRGLRPPPTRPDRPARRLRRCVQACGADPGDRRTHHHAGRPGVCAARGVPGDPRLPRAPGHQVAAVLHHLRHPPRRPRRPPQGQGDRRPTGCGRSTTTPTTTRSWSRSATGPTPAAATSRSTPPPTPCAPPAWPAPDHNVASFPSLRTTAGAKRVKGGPKDHRAATRSALDAHSAGRTITAQGRAPHG